MEEYETLSDKGGVLLASAELELLIPTNVNDDSREAIVRILESIEKVNPSAKFITKLYGKFNVYNYDCASTSREDNVIASLNGIYNIFSANGVVYIKEITRY